ncbi:MAG TPA: BMP family ABC transporter substrate-binding protein [Chloroflexota bacterium]
MMTFHSPRMRTRLGAWLAILVAVALGAPPLQSAHATTAHAPGLRAVLVSIQPVNDKGVMQDFVTGFNQGARQYHFTTNRLVVVQNASAYVSTLQTVASQFDLVITTFPPMIQAVQTVAPKFPNVHFVLLDAQITKPLPNVQTLFFKENESSYLAGIVAGMMTKTNKVGFLGALVQDVINRYLVGFDLGTKRVNPRAQVCWAYVNALEDPALGKQFALTMYRKNIDIIHAATAGTEVGVYQASMQAHKYLIGADVNILPLDPTYGLTATGPDFSGAARIIMKQQATGTFVAGRHQYGLKDGAVRILPFNTRLVPAKVRAKVRQVERMIINGQIHVPTDTYLKNLKNCG